MHKGMRSIGQERKIPFRGQVPYSDPAGARNTPRASDCLSKGNIVGGRFPLLERADEYLLPSGLEIPEFNAAIISFGRPKVFPSGENAMYPV